MNCRVSASSSSNSREGPCPWPSLALCLCVQCASEVSTRVSFRKSRQEGGALWAASPSLGSTCTGAATNLKQLIETTAVSNWRFWLVRFAPPDSVTRSLHTTTVSIFQFSKVLVHLTESFQREVDGQSAEEVAFSSATWVRQRCTLQAVKSCKHLCDTYVRVVAIYMRAAALPHFQAI